ncbi:MAG: hypothetical protein AVDCRST_MAG54-3978 [uncultured Actinomycetospora sp.]|uniref:Uncharacterized protein n=1 Tax=uncultured Actinomycetospora sp. TaxID=1135996 RepID=A0A6J4JRS8_9PSEU|nr:MAG: hypothetical protein AVDCRST_MAG54-3978 [uncultured Actinomycetospora sp.]
MPLLCAQRHAHPCPRQRRDRRGRGRGGGDRLHLQCDDPCRDPARRTRRVPPSGGRGR